MSINTMTGEEARQEVIRRWREILPQYASPAKDKVNGEKSYICPFCGHGTHGDGLTFDRKSKAHGLHCFGCGFSGNIIDLVMKEENEDFFPALKECADIIGIEIESKGSAAADFAPQKTDKKEAQEKQENTEKPQVDYTAYYQECHRRLADEQAGKAGREYLQKRGISIETVLNAGMIGYDPAADPANNPGGTGHSIYPTPRIIIPTSTTHYVGRAIDPAAKIQKANAKGAAAWLFNARAIDNSPVVFIVEGWADALSIIEVGGAAVALNSTSNAGKLIEYVQQRKANTETAFVICLDNDSAGREGAEKLKQAFSSMGLKYAEANITGSHKDANEALQADRATFAARVKEAERAPFRDTIDNFLLKVQTEAYKPIPTGIQFFDNLLSGGPIRQTVTLLLASPATGKTTLYQMIAEEMARHGTDVIYLNLEMSREQMIAKALSHALTFGENPIAMSMKDILQGYRWTEEQRRAVTQAAEAYRKKNLPHIRYITVNEVSGDIEAIREYITAAGDKAKAEKKAAPIIFLDYLHLVKAHEGAGKVDAQELIKQALKILKDYAIGYDSIVFTIGAINRTSTGRITLNSGRDSSAIEYTADSIISLEYYDIDAGKLTTSDSHFADKYAEEQKEPYRRMMLRTLKDRNGQGGNFERCYYDPKTNGFYGENDFIPDLYDVSPFTPFTSKPDYLDREYDADSAAGKNKKRIVAAF